MQVPDVGCNILEALAPTGIKPSAVFFFRYKQVVNGMFAVTIRVSVFRRKMDSKQGR